MRHLLQAILFVFASLVLAACGTQTPASQPSHPAIKKLYVSASGSVIVINRDTNAIISTITMPGTGSSSIAVNPATSKAYITNHSNNTVSVINTITDTIIATIPVGTQPYSIAINPATNKAYVANYGSSNISVIDTTTNTVVATIPVRTTPWGIALNPAANQMYISHSFNNGISTINTATNTVLSVTGIGAFYPTGIVFNPASNSLYIVNSSTYSISNLDITSNTVLAGILGAGYDIAINSAINKCYISYGNTIRVLDMATNTIVSSITVGVQPMRIGFDIISNRAYVANFQSNSISVIDTLTNTVILIIPLPNSPYDAAIN